MGWASPGFACFEQSSGASFGSQQIQSWFIHVVLFIKNDSSNLSFLPSPFTNCTFLVGGPNLNGFEKAIFFNDEVIWRVILVVALTPWSFICSISHSPMRGINLGNRRLLRGMWWGAIKTPQENRDRHSGQLVSGRCFAITVTLALRDKDSASIFLNEHGAEWSTTAHGYAARCSPRAVRSYNLYPNPPKT